MAKRSFDSAPFVPTAKLWEDLEKASEAGLRLEAEMLRRETITGGDGRTRKVLANGPEGHDLNGDRIASSFAATRRAELALLKRLGEFSEAEEHQDWDSEAVDWQTAEFTRQAENDLAAIAASLGVELSEAEEGLSEAEEQRFCPVSDRWTSWSGDYDWSEAPVEDQDQDISVGDVTEWLLADLS
tara:strand:+ start:1301 stop:1855 length:555 start_codon:yes stop_codon:yes gene_type:complete